MRGYEITEVTSDIGGRGFKVWPHGAAEPYYVLMMGQYGATPEYGSCECE